ncbi:MAG: AzlD domain-containing protein [Candidimonas sp.]|jgi:branched-subunit amino acid transport protein
MTERDLYVLGAIILLTVVSFITRAGYFMLGDYLPLSNPVRRALRYAPVAALIGIIVPELLPWEPGKGVVLDAKVFACLAAIYVFYRVRNVVALIVTGMVSLWLLRYLFG